MHPAAAPFHRQRPLAHAQNPVRPRESRLAWYPQPGAVIVRPTKQGPPLLPTPLPPWTPRVGLGSPAASTLSRAGENMQSASMLAEPMGLIHTIKRPLQPCPPGSSKPSATDSKEAVASLARALAPAPAMRQVGAVGAPATSGGCGAVAKQVCRSSLCPLPVPSSASCAARSAPLRD